MRLRQRLGQPGNEVSAGTDLQLSSSGCTEMRPLHQVPRGTVGPPSYACIQGSGSPPHPRRAKAKTWFCPSRLLPSAAPLLILLSTWTVFLTSGVRGGGLAGASRTVFLTACVSGGTCALPWGTGGKSTNQAVQLREDQASCSQKSWSPFSFVFTPCKINVLCYKETEIVSHRPY